MAEAALRQLPSQELVPGRPTRFPESLPDLAIGRRKGHNLGHVGGLFSLSEDKECKREDSQLDSVGIGSVLDDAI